MSELSGFDNDGIAIEPFTQEPQEKLILPKIEAQQKWFMRLGIPDRTSEDRNATALIITKKDGDLIYIDRNNDENLTNDGEPVFFPLNENNLWISVSSTTDPNRKLSALYQREPKSLSGKPNYRSKLNNDSVVDSEGQLHYALVHITSQRFPGFEGKPRTFYCKQSLPLRRGAVPVSDAVYQIALYDMNFNGLFTDPKDRLLIDTGGDGAFYKRASNESFNLNDVFPLGSKNYKLSQVDPYGKYVDIVETTEKQTSLFIANRTKLKGEEEQSIGGKLNPAFWNLEFKTIDGESIKLADYKGLYLLFNFWGEWCAPCLFEMPTIVRAQQRYPESKMALIGMLNTNNLNKARQTMDNLHISWPQVRFDDKVSKLFTITSYPTNILIMPDGQTYIEQGYIDDRFFTAITD